MKESKKCVCGHPMTVAEWKNQWVCHRCGRTRSLHKIDRHIVYAEDIHKTLLELGWDADTAELFLNNLPNA